MKSTKNGRGRPRLSSGRAKSESLLLRMHPAEKEAFQDAANLAGVPLAVWMRERLRVAAKKELDAADRTVAFLPDRKAK